MKKLIIILSLTVVAVITNAQIPSDSDVPPPPPPTESKDIPVFTVVEQMPEFPGGEDALLKFLGKNIHYPELARDCGCQGTIYASFIVIEDGSIINPRILRAIKGCDDLTTGNKKEDKEQVCRNASKAMSDESIRVISNMPKWEPGKQNGKAIRVQYNLPIKYTLR